MAAFFNVFSFHHTEAPSHSSGTENDANFPLFLFLLIDRAGSNSGAGSERGHLPQPLQSSSLTCGKKLLVCTGCSMPNRRAAIMASQQQPQQLQMKLTRSRTFSPN